MDIGLISLLGILFAMGLLIWGSFKGVPILLLGPLTAIIILATSDMDIVEGLTNNYAESFAGFAQSNFLIFLPATILGAMLGDCGAAQHIANKIASISQRRGGKNSKFWVLMGLSLITAILSFGGVSGFVVIFTIAPICFRIFKQMDIPWHFVIAVSVYGGSMWTAILPGSPAIQNLIPMEYLGTSPRSAPMIGIFAALSCLVFGAVYIWWMLKRNERRGEGFMETGKKMDTYSSTLALESTGKEMDTHSSTLALKSTDKKMDTYSSTLALKITEIETTNWDFVKALLPSIAMLVAMNVFLITPFVSLTIGCLVCIALYYNKFTNLSNTLSSGALSTMKSIMNVAAVVGFGGVVNIVPGFDFLVENLDKIPGPPLIQLALATNIVSGIVGSASGGEAISLEVFASRFLEAGINPNVIHRIVNISCYGLDSLPHNGSAINRLNYTHLTYREGYYHEFILGAIYPLLNSFLAVFIASLGII
mgnify:CR=1 FL=1